MPHHEWRPLRKRSPWIGSRPGVFVALPPRRPRPALIVAAVTALLPRALPPQPQITRVRRLTPPPAAEQRQPNVSFPTTPAVLLNRGGRALLVIPPRPAAVTPPTAGSLRAVKVYGGRGRLILPVVPGTGTAVTLTAGPPGFREALVLRGLPPPSRSRIVLTDVPNRTVRLAAFQLDATVVKRDERRGAGRVFASKVPDRTVRLAAFQTDALIVRRDTRGFAGAVLFATPHRPTFRLPAGETRALVVKRDERRFGGAVFTVKVPDRTLRLDAFQLDATLVRRDERRFAGRVVLGTPARTGAAVIVPTTAKLSARVVRRDERRFSGAVFTDRVPARTLRLASFQEDALVVRRDERRYAGAVFIVKIPARTVRLAAFQEGPRVLLRPYPERGRGAVWSSAPHRDTTARPAKAALVLRPVPPPFRGQVFTVRVPARTVRLDAFQLDATLVRRDERRFAGRVFLASPSRTGTAVIIPRLPHHLIASVDRRRFAGSITTSHVPSRTVRLDAFQAAALLVHRDERRSAGRVLIGSPSRTAVAVVVPRLPRLLVAGREARGFAGRVVLNKVPSRTLRLIAPELRVLFLKRDERRYAGAVLLTPVHRSTAPVGAARGALVAQQAGAFPAVRPVVLVAPKRRSFVLAPGLTRSHVFTRQSFPPRGAVLWVRPVRPKVVFRIPEAAVIRRDERGFAGRQLTSPVSRQNAVAALLGNPRARVTLQPGPAALLTVRPAPTAAVSVRPAPVAELTFKEG